MSELIYNVRRFVQNDFMTHHEKALRLLRRRGVLRPRDLIPQGIRPATLWELEQRGLVERVGRGVYRAVGHETTPLHALATVAKQVPGGIVCLLSALAFHHLTTQLPHEVWLAVGPKDRKPRHDWPRLRIVRFSGDAFNAGRELHIVERVEVQVYSAAKTVADCFKYRRKIGLDVAVEALRDYLRSGPVSADELVRYARVCRVWNVMRPYVEALA